MDYEKKYLELTSGFYKCCDDISKQYPDCSGFEKCIIALRKKQWFYADIQKWLGMPSKKTIREVLLKWAPELIDNKKSKIVEISPYESELYNIIFHTNRTDFEFEGDPIKLYIKDCKLIFNDGDEYLVHDFNEIIQKQLLIAIKDQLNGK